MTNRLTKIITKKGDKGITSVDGKNFLAKNSPRIAALGNIDELNSAIGIVIAYLTKKEQEIINALSKIQNNLFNIGSELCPPYKKIISENSIDEIEKIAKHWNANLPPLKEFILPGGSIAAAHCHLARTICRRAERVLVGLNLNEKINPELLKYLNRLSDLLFIAARLINQQQNITENYWQAG